MARVDITEADAAEAVIKQLRTSLDLTEATCFFTEEPEHIIPFPTGAEFFVTVSLGGSVFPQEEQVPEQLYESVDLEVTGYSHIVLDQSGHAKSLYLDARRGLMEVKRRILKALIGEDLTTDLDNTFLRQLLYAKSARKPFYDPNQELGLVFLTFGLDFDWDIT